MDKKPSRVLPLALTALPGHPVSPPVQWVARTDRRLSPELQPMFSCTLVAQRLTGPPKADGLSCSKAYLTTQSVQTLLKRRSVAASRTFPLLYQGCRLTACIFGEVISCQGQTRLSDQPSKLQWLILARVDAVE